MKHGLNQRKLFTRLFSKPFSMMVKNLKKKIEHLVRKSLIHVLYALLLQLKANTRTK